MDESYKKWEKYANKVAWADMEDGKPKNTGSRSFDPKNVSVFFGEPMSEEEFKALHKGKSPVVINGKK
jgi:hypothetical protein